jgi:hypothetical protein
MCQRSGLLLARILFSDKNIFTIQIKTVPIAAHEQIEAHVL